jgi:hypothetical protein
MLGETALVVYEGDVERGNKNFFFDASILNSGIYQVVITSGTLKQVQKLVIY